MRLSAVGVRYVFFVCILIGLPGTVSGQVLGGHRPQATAPRDFGFLTAFRTTVDIKHLNGADADTRFNWDADLAIDVDVVDAGYFRGNLFINIETIIGNEFRGVDPNQNNYTADLSVFTRLPKGELSTTFHHVSRHLADRATDKSVSWNMFGVGYGNTFTLGNLNLDAGVRALWTVERAGVDYDAQYGGYLKVIRPFNDRLALIGTIDGVSVRIDPFARNRSGYEGGQLEAGLRITTGVATVDLLVGHERRIDATSTLRELTELTRWTQFGIRLTTPIR